MKSRGWIVGIAAALVLTAVQALAQTGTVSGKVFDADGSPLRGITARIVVLQKTTASNSSGVYTLNSVTPGTHTLLLSGVGFKTKARTIRVEANVTTLLDDTMAVEAKNMEEVVVYGVSRREQKITDAPAAVSVVLPEDVQRATAHGQAARTLTSFQGVDVVQSGMNDFNVNTRGFNNSINRRVLVMTDGRDMSTPLLNLVEWNSFQTNLADIKTIEVVRGPGSALYGSNAYNGVVNIITNAPKDVLGTRLSVTGGQFGTFRADARHAREITDALSIKANIGYSQQNQDWITSRDITDTINPGARGSLEYAGLAPDVRGNRFGIGNIGNIDSLINARRKAYNISGSLRADYELNTTDKIITEIGYSEYGNEFFVNQTGRILIPQVTKPYARLAYASPRVNVQAHYYNRNTPIPQIVMNAAASSAERSNVVVIDAQWNDSYLDNDLKLILGASHEYQHVNTSIVGALPLLSPDNLHNNFSGVYGQLEYNILKNLQFVGAARFDRSTFFENQFSPKAAIVYSPVANHTFRATFNRSFLRPSYGDLNRRSPAGPPRTDLAAIDSSIAAQFGVQRLGLGVASRWNNGNPNISVESAQSFELGYKGIITSQLYVTVDAYYNRRANFISVPLGGLAPEVYPTLRYGNVQADSALRARLNPTNAPAGLNDYDRLARDVNGAAALIVSTRNIGIVNEYGLEFGANYYATNNLLLGVNASFLDFNVQDNQTSVRILPNASPRRINISAQYTEPKLFDAGFVFRYVEGFDWIAGTVSGGVPAYAVLDLNASLDMSRWVDGVRLGVSVTNALDRRHYQIFGGTILQRYATATLSYQF
ncbi:MAG: TonB-dependent receptor [Candidatus Kapabacteria bacterium]|nr:TonB-dependent receptor [Candidatus Kapabacteria bacterium]